MENVQTEKIVHLSTMKNTQDEAQGDLRGMTNDDLHLVRDHPRRAAEGEIRQAPAGEVRDERDLEIVTRERKRRLEERKLPKDRHTLQVPHRRVAQAVVRRFVSIFKRPANLSLGTIAGFHMQTRIPLLILGVLPANKTVENQTLEIEVVAYRMKVL